MWTVLYKKTTKYIITGAVPNRNPWLKTEFEDLLKKLKAEEKYNTWSTTLLFCGSSVLPEKCDGWKISLNVSADFLLFKLPEFIAYDHEGCHSQSQCCCHGTVLFSSAVPTLKAAQYLHPGSWLCLLQVPMIPSVSTSTRRLQWALSSRRRCRTLFLFLAQWPRS